jgi:ribosomal protein S18 acetylase RimI-like enzyme
MSTSPTIAIRTARLDDYAAACRLMDGVDELHRDRLPWMFKAPDSPPRSEAFFAERLNRQDAAVFVADAGPIVGIAIGMMRAAPEHAVFIQQRYGVIDDIVVDPAFRRRGIATLLAHAVETWATSLGAPWVELNVYDFNTEARRFYEALGYLPLFTRLRKPRSPGAV